MTSRMRLRREDGEVYLNRWGWERDWLGGIFIHRMDAPDPGIDLHDHPWTFWSLILWGGYEEERCEARVGSYYAEMVEKWGGRPKNHPRGVRRPLSVRRMDKHECHTITNLLGCRSWSIVIHGPRVDGRRWGFYVPGRWVDHDDYDALERRKLYADRVGPGQPADR